MQFYNSDQMRELRTQLLNGETPAHCATCYYEESFGKLNGRLRQLNKSAIDLNNFDLSIRSSPHYNNFEYSMRNTGLANMAPADLQIDLGNTCNSACIMCDPRSSSRLETEYRKLHKINSTLFKQPNIYQSWTKNPVLVQQFVDQLKDIPNLRYVHFLGGETLYDQAFYSICDRLIELDLAKDIIVGTTTNGTIYNERIQLYIKNFKQFHLGISIESVTELNDYVRWPGKIQNILSNIDCYLHLREQAPGLQISLRITPNVFTIWEIDQLFTYMIENSVIAESCNILWDPAHLRMELIPDDIRSEIKTRLEHLIDYYALSKDDTVVNIRRSDLVSQVTANVIIDYYNFICNFVPPDNVEQSRHQLVNFLHAFEQLRGNRIIDHVPRYEKFLRTYGY
jgi:hypothetical protein